MNKKAPCAGARKELTSGKGKGQKFKKRKKEVEKESNKRVHFENSPGLDKSRMSEDPPVVLQLNEGKDDTWQGSRIWKGKGKGMAKTL